jgi:hypothetical protein
VQSTRAARVDTRPRKALAALGTVVAISGLSLAVSGAFSLLLLHSASGQDPTIAQAPRAGHSSEIKEPADQPNGLFGACLHDHTSNGDNYDPGIQYRCEGRRCDLPSSTSTCVGTIDNTGAKEAEYDPSIIGGGIQAAYLAQSPRNRLGEEANKLKICIFESNTHFGGRLMSAYSGGDLGLGVQAGEATTKMVPPEYGGMRIGPYAHPLAWDAMEQVAHQHGKTCTRSGPKLSTPGHGNFLAQWLGRGLPKELETTGSGCTDPNEGYMQKM